MLPIAPEITALIDRALEEDLSSGDLTTAALISADLKGRATIVAKADGVLAGVDVAMSVFRRVDPGLRVTAALGDGSMVAPPDSTAGAEGDVIAKIDGSVSSILVAERTALNFLQHLSGIATETSRYVRAVAGYNARIVDTRKTLPGLRSLQKYAVRVGGGRNHRRSLGDGILIKDNHLSALRRVGVTLAAAVRMALAEAPHTLKVQVEVERLEDVKEALEAGAELLLLDNMGLEELAQAVEEARGRAVTEASGGINIDSVRAVAATGVDIISVGALTHSARALDVSLDLV